MIELFKKIDHIKYDVTGSGKYDYLNKLITRDCNISVEYYRKRSSVVENNNVFSKIIKTIGPNVSLDIYEYTSLVNSRLSAVCRTYGIMTPTINGKLTYDNVFRKSVELIVNKTDTDYFLNMYKQDWKGLSPLKLNKSDIIDFNYNHPRNIDANNSYSSFSLNIEEMLYMYRCWCLENKNNDRDYNPNRFVYQYLLPNMIKDVFNYSVINLFAKIIERKDYILIKDSKTITTTNITKEIKKYVYSIINKTDNKTLRYQHYLKHIKLFMDTDILKFLKLEPGFVNTQTNWYNYYSRLTLIKFLLYVSNKKNIKMNRIHIENLKIDIKQLENGKHLQECNDEILLFLLEYDIEEIKNIIGSR